MSVNFFKHKAKLVEAYKDVLDDNSDTDWALFSYEGNQNDLKLQDTGDEGLEELEPEFNSGKIMYAFVRVKDPNTKLTKFILIVWQGEGVPATRKGACANHVKDIARFFQGSHMTIYCRNDDEITPEEIMKQVTKATSNFSFVAPKEDISVPSPVSSVYQPINPQREILSSRNDKFWIKMQQEEDARKAEEKQKAVNLRKQEAVEIREREKKWVEARNQMVKQRERDIAEKLRAQKLADDRSDIREKEKAAWQAQEREQERELQDLRKARRSQSIESAHEAEVLTTQRANNPRAMWAQREKEASAPPPVSNNQKHQLFHNHPIQPEPAQEPEQAYQPEPSYQQEPSYQPEPSYEPEQSYAQVEPEAQPSDDANQIYGNEPVETTADQQNNQQEPYDDQAEDDTEISFDPGEVVTDIEQIDEGWWRGTAPDGSRGIFPANYVRLL
uniref:Coactosin-like protein n=1 Tax=Ciona savignyi TaxID=51511 RepID=H2YL55_CIOSA